MYKRQDKEYQIKQFDVLLIKPKQGQAFIAKAYSVCGSKEGGQEIVVNRKHNFFFNVRSVLKGESSWVERVAIVHGLNHNSEECNIHEKAEILKKRTRSRD